LSILDFMIENMSNQKNGFYSSYDADSEGEEGLFYIWNYDEIVLLTGDEDGSALAMLLGVSQSGNFEGANIITRRIKPKDVALKFNRDVKDIENLYEKYQQKMKSYRDSRIMPGLDKKIITSWNGLAIAAMAQAYAVFNDEKYRKSAEDAADYIWRIHHRENGSLYRSSYDGEAENQGILDDYAFLAYGLVELYIATGEIKHYKKAIKLIDFVQAHFKYPEAGYYLTLNDYEAPLGRRVEYFDSVRPSGNSTIMQVLLKMASLEGNSSLYKELQNTINAFADKMKNAGLEMACWWDTAEKLSGPFYEVVIVGDPDKISTRKMISTYWQIYPSHAVLVNLTSNDRELEIANLFPLVSGKNTTNEKATAYVCQFGTCKLPTNDPEIMRKQISEGWTF